SRESWIFPHIAGQRGTGAVESVGSHVRSVAVGDRVAIMTPVNCNACEGCYRGLSNLCPNAYLFGNESGSRGALAECALAPEWSVAKLSDTMSFTRATMLGDMALMVHAYERALTRPGFTTAVYGCGRVGTCAVAVARAYGASRIVAIDTRLEALELARQC